jgi:hypothetical protein
MSTDGTYEAPYAPRFHIDGDVVVIPAHRQMFIMAFLCVWLCGWTFGGAAALSQLLQHFQPFLLFWLCGWVLGEGFALSTLAWMAAGRETLRVINGDLEISAQVFAFVRRRRYRGATIRDLSAGQYIGKYPNGRARMDVPLVWAPSSGGVKFAYGARTVFAGVGLDEPEGRMIVDFLKRRLPKTASDPA